MTTPAGQPPKSLATTLDLAKLATKDNAILMIAAAIAFEHFGVLQMLTAVC